MLSVDSTGLFVSLFALCLSVPLSFIMYINDAL